MRSVRRATRADPQHRFVASQPGGRRAQTRPAAARRTAGDGRYRARAGGPIPLLLCERQEDAACALRPPPLPPPVAWRASAAQLGNSVYLINKSQIGDWMKYMANHMQHAMRSATGVRWDGLAEAFAAGIGPALGSSPPARVHPDDAAAITIVDPDGMDCDGDDDDEEAQTAMAIARVEAAAPH
eukprot:gene2189-30219_t